MRLFRSVIFCGVGASLVAASAFGSGSTDPIKLSVSSPKAKGKVGLLQDDGWHLTFRLRSTTAADYFEVRERFEGGSDFDLLVLENPDDCLDLSHANTVGGAFEAACPGGADETFITFNIDSAATPRFLDKGCSPPFSDDLTNTPVTDFVSQGGTVPFTEASKSYYSSSLFGRLWPSGPNTEDASNVVDCYGYGTDEDLPSLVVMANAGGAKVYDTDLTFDTTRIRNMAGLLTSVGYELLNKRDETAVVANLFVTNGMFEPQVFVDLGATPLAGGAPTTNPTFKYQVDEGPLTTVNLIGSYDTPALLAAIQEKVGPQRTVKLRAAIVEGPAPAFIDDLDGNGKFNAKDLVLAGYRVLSNQTVTTLNLIERDTLRFEEDGYECPSNLLYTDLDGDGQASFCQDGDGTSRSAIRVPR